MAVPSYASKINFAEPKPYEVKLHPEPHRFE
jgi:hypothetical protein